MISYIKGNIEYVFENFIILDNNGIGYKIFVSNSFICNINNDINLKNSEIKIFTYMNVKEDNISLYGFQYFEELELFNKIITVSGIGPKVALGIISNIDVNDFVMAVLSEDINTISKAPSIGKKMAQKIIIELKDKICNLKYSNNIKYDDNVKYDSVEALCVLGYQRNEALKVVSDVFFEGATTEEILKLALKKF